MTTRIIKKSKSLYDASCQNCSKLNRNLYLNETLGIFECDACGTINNVLDQESEGNHFETEHQLLFLETTSATA